MTPLSSHQLRAQLLKPKDTPHQRVSIIQQPVVSKYSGQENTSVTRILYSYYGRCGVWAVTKKTAVGSRPITTRPLLPSKLSVEFENEKPTFKSVCKKMQIDSRFIKLKRDSPGVADKLDTNDFGKSPKTPIKKQLTFAENDDSPVRSPVFMSPQLRHQSTISRFTFSDNELGGSPICTETDSRRLDTGLDSVEAPATPGTKNIAIEDVFNLLEDGPDAAGPQTNLEKYSLDSCFVDSVNGSAADELLKMTAEVAKHFSKIFRRKMTDIVIDVIKDNKDRFVLVDIIAFRFDDTEVAPFTLTTRVLHLIEETYQCVLDPSFSNQIDEAAVDPSRKKFIKESCESLNGVDLSANPICNMCESRIPIQKLRFAITSTMIQSTIMHMRSRLPVAYWPNFCRDQCPVVRAMLRLEETPFDFKALTEVNIKICELCFDICQKEMALIDVEQKLAKFTRNSVIVCFDNVAITAPKSDFRSKSQLNPNLLTNSTADSFRLRNRPSIALKLTSPIRSPDRISSKNVDENDRSNQDKINVPHNHKVSLLSNKLDTIQESGSSSQRKSSVRANFSRLRRASFDCKDINGGIIIDSGLDRKSLNVNTPGEYSPREKYTPTAASSLLSSTNRSPPRTPLTRVNSSPQLKSTMESLSQNSKSGLPSATENDRLRELPVPAIGRRVNRIDLAGDYTLCRMMFGVHEVQRL